jgi:hypothetical protein
VRAAGVHWDGTDNHSRQITVGGYTAMGNQTFANVLIDSIILERLGDPSLELVGNSFLQQFVDEDTSALGQAKLAELLTINGVHSYQAIDGPDTTFIDEARADRYLKSFRRWMSEKRALADPRELKDIKEAVEASLRRIQDELFLKWLDPAGHAINVGKSVLLDAIGVLLPGAEVVASAIEEGLRYRKAKELRWQGFIVSMRNKTSTGKQ